MAEAVAEAMTERRAPARPGRHRHRQVARLPRARAAPRPPGGGRHRDPRPPAPARRARHPAAGRGVEASPSRSVDTSYAVLKGRSNYACLHRIREGVPDDQGALVEVPQGSMAKKVLELRAWAEREAESGGSGERDHAPRHTDREWRQVSVSHRECLGATRCPFGAGVLRRGRPRGGPPLPPDRHQPLAAGHRRHRGRADDPRLRRRGGRRGPRARRPGHPGRDRRAARLRRRARGPALPAARRGESNAADDLADAADALAAAIDEAEPGPVRRRPRGARATRWCWSATPRGPACRRTPARPRAPATARSTPAAPRPAASVQEVFVTAERMAADSEADVLWLTEGGDRIPPRLCVAPLQVWGPMRDKLLSDKTGGVHLGDADARRRLLRDGGLHRPQAGRAGRHRRRPGQRRAPRRGRPAAGAASTSGRRSTTAARRSSTSPATCRRPAATASARRSSTRSSSWSTPPRAARSGCSAHAGPPRRRPPRRPRAAAPPDHARAGRRPAARAGPAVRRGPPHVPVRHAQPLAGPRRAGRDLPAGAHRPHPVPAARRPADVARVSARPTRRAATASCRSPPPTPRCYSRRGPAG